MSGVVWFDGDPYVMDAEGEWAEQHHTEPTHTKVEE